MDRRAFFKSGAAAIASSALLGTLQHGEAIESDAGEQAFVPLLEDLASAWLDCGQLAHMPSLHNFREMAACAPDMAGVNFCPGGQLYAGSGPRWYKYHSLPLCQFSLDGQSYEAKDCRWFAYQAVRRVDADGLEIITTNRMVPEDTTVLWRIQFRNTRTTQRTFQAGIRIPGVLDAESQPHAVHYSDPKTGLSSKYGFLEDATFSKPEKDTTDVHWKLTLEPGESCMIRFAMAAGRSGYEPSSSTLGQPDLAATFERNWNAARTTWEERWRAAFTPGNPFFSGHAPILVTKDVKIREIYYRSILTLLVLLRTGFWSDRVFITSGERAEGILYYWDTSLFATVFALLEPRAMKEQIKWFLEQDPHQSSVIRFASTRPSQAKSIPVLPGWDLRGYAANDISLFRLAVTYLSVNQDRSFLHESIADQTVLKRLEVLANNWKKLLNRPNDRLADYGEARNLLECVPTYIHQVPSFNAANVWMMRELAEIIEGEGDADKARKLRTEADSMAAAVMTLYIPGTGYWSSLHRDGSRVEMRHCYDFATVSRFMTNDLPKHVKNEMVSFVERELLTERWMRAQSLEDVAAARSDRPDHGPMGAYDAWPAVTVDGMCSLGFWRQAISFLRRTQAGLREGVYAQAHEFYGPSRGKFDAPVRIAQREGCMRECSSGGAFAETILTTLFGYAPKFGRDLLLFAPGTSRGVSGELRHVRHGSQMLTIISREEGPVFRHEEPIS